MTHAQTIIDSLLTGYTNMYEIPEEAESLLDRVRQRIVASADVRRDLEMLYGAADCDQLALGLLWVVERAGEEPERTEPSDDELEAVHGAVTTTLTAMGFFGSPAEQGDEAPDEPVALESPAEEEATEAHVEAEPEVQSEPGPTEHAEPEIGDTTMEPADVAAEAAEEPAMLESEEAAVPPQETAPAAPAGGATTDAAEIGALLEQFLDALQSGTDERDALINSLRASFAACLTSDTTDPSLRSYSEVVQDFLGYIQENDLLDDVRVMNFFTNVQEPYDQWMNAADGEKEGLLEQAIEILHDFRAMFE